MIGAIIAIDHAEAAHPRLLEGERRLAAGFGQPFPFGPKQLPLAHRLAALRPSSLSAPAPRRARQARKQDQSRSCPKDTCTGARSDAAAGCVSEDIERADARAGEKD